MGSTSSKEHDPNPAELGTYASSGGVNTNSNTQQHYPLRHHPQYSNANGPSITPSSSSTSTRQFHGDSTRRIDATDDALMATTSSGHDPYYTHADTRHHPTSRHTDAMDIDPPPASSTQTTTDNDASSSSSSLQLARSTSITGSLESESDALSSPSDVVPMVFRWEHGGRNVLITGTFNGWTKQCPMHRSGNDFTFIANLSRGKHAYKFVVDDEWRFAPDQLTVADVEGNVNNFVDVSDFAPLSDFETTAKQRDADNESAYGRFMPDIDEYTKEPPPLPPHLRHIILNKTPPTVDSRLLPVPQHVALNHLYCTAIKDGMMVLGITNRYKQKFVTTVYYSLMPGAN